MKPILHFTLLPLLLLTIFGACSPDSATDKMDSKTQIKSLPGSAGKADSTTSLRSNRKGSAGSGGEFQRGHTNPSTVVDDGPATGPMLLVSGRITFDDGRPATSVGVELRGNVKIAPRSVMQTSLGRAVTDGEGAYKVRGVDASQALLLLTGDVPETQVQLDPTGHVLSTRPGLSRVRKDIVLPTGYTLVGRVINEKDLPMPGVAVSLRPIVTEDLEQRRLTETRPIRDRETTTSATGEFLFDLISPGPWNLGALSPDYAVEIQRVEIPTTNPVTLRLASQGGTVRGHVYQKLDTSPAPGIKLELATRGSNRMANLESKKAVSANDGTFRFDHVSSGAMTLLIAEAESLENPMGMAAPYPGEFQLAEKETTDVVLFVYPGHTIQGLVFDKDTSEPLSGAVVSASGGPSDSKTATSDSSGKYVLNHVFQGQMFGSHQVDSQLNAKLEGYSLDAGNIFQTAISVKLPEDASVPVVKDLPMLRMVTISGTVVSRDEVPLPNAQVAFMTPQNFGNTEPKTNVQPDGTFKLEVKPFTGGFVEAEASGFGRGESRQLELTTADITDLKIILDVGATVQGVVVDPEGKPATGAKVQDYVSHSFSAGSSNSTFDEIAMTGEDGTFTMKDAPIKVELFAGKDTFADTERQSIDLKPGEMRSGVVLKLRKGLIISGRVVKRDKSPVAGAMLNANGTGGVSDSDTTDKDGAFKIDGLLEGSCRVYVWGNGKTKTLENIHPGTTDLEIVLDDEEGVTFTGTVLDDVTGDPVRDLVVKGQMAKNLPQPGKFQIPNLGKNTTYGIIISSPKHEAQNFRISTSDVDRGERTFRLGLGGIIVGRVVEKGTKKPIPNVTVVNWGGIESYMRGRSTPPNHSTTDGEGRFTLAPAPSGESTVNIKPAEPLAELSKSITVKSEETADLGDIEVSSGGTIRGRVVQGAGDDPAPEKKVTLSCYSQSVQVNKTFTTDAQGAFECTGLAPATYNLAVGSVSKSQKVTADETVEVLLRIGGVKITGTVTQGGKPVEVNVSGSGATDISFNAYARGGKYTLTDVLPGKYIFTVGSGTSPLKETVEVPDQADFEKNFVLPDGRLAVSVTDAAGQPVSGALVSLTLKNSSSGVEQSWVNRSQTQTSKSDGTAQFAGLTPGTYTLSAQKDDVGSATNPGVSIRDGAEENLKLVLKGDGGTLVSVALSSVDGQPIPDAWCYLYGPDGTFGHNTKRDSSGLMTIKNIPPGTYRTNVSNWGYSQNEKQVEIKAGETATIEDVLFRAGSIQWILKKADGTPAQGANVQLTPLAADSTEGPRTGVTDRDGNYEDRGLPPGPYQLTAQLPGKAAISDTFEVKAQSHTKKENTVTTW